MPVYACVDKCYFFVSELMLTHFFAAYTDLNTNTVRPGGNNEAQRTAGF
jgi:hypothetical protein